MLKMVINMILSNLIIMKDNNEANELNGIGALEKPVGSLQILVHLHKNEKATITNLIKDAELNQRTTYSALDSLQAQGLVCQEKTNGFPISKYYKLTEKGNKVAEQLGVVALMLVGE